MKSERLQKITGGTGILSLAALFTVWWVKNKPTTAGLCAALISAGLFALLCLRFIKPLFSLKSTETCPLESEEEKGTLGKIFALTLLWDGLIILAVTAVRALAGESVSLDFWRCADSQHYLAIAEDWYLSEGSVDRLVQLVFLPGYPIALRCVNCLVGNYLISGLLLSALCFGGSACVFYKLLRLDMGREKALRCLRFMCILPGAFFFAAPMSESLFLLLSLSCFYFARRGRFPLAGLFGALSCFTRSVGLALLVPVLFELIQQKRKPRDFLCLFIIPLGFAAYCLINYAVAGDAFKFMEYQREHWHQSFGLFFNTAAYQTEYALRSFASDKESFFGLWLPNLLAQLFALVIMCRGVRHLRASYSAYFIACFFVAMGATWLLSAPRYLAVMFPLGIALGEMSEKPKAEAILTALCLLAGLLYLICFALRWQVW